MPKMTLLTILVLLALLAAPCARAEKDWTTDCNKCKCVWSSGKKFADCRSLHFSEIPRDLSHELREIDFSGNPFYELAAHEFGGAGLQNIHKLRLQNCSIATVHPDAFQSLQLLIELDLSQNQIKQLDSAVFKDNTKLRILYLSKNRLRQLGSNMFPNMTHLQRIHLDNNRLEAISEEVFGAACPISHMSLENNKLSYLPPSVIDRLPKLSSIDLAGNPWMCDCKLESFRRLALDNNWVTQTIECQQPERLKGREWNDESVIFACEPKIVEPSPNAVLEIDSVNYTLPCKVEGTPRPSVLWMTNGRNVDTHRNAAKYHISSSKEWPYWDNLTIINVNIRDRGEYKCVATNPGGNDERNVTVYLRGTDYMGGGTLSSTSMSNMMLLIILLSVGAIILLVVVLLLICLCCNRNQRARERPAKNRPKESTEYIGMDGHPGEMEKSLITDVNPVSKPPRQYSMPASVTSGGTEVSEVKTKLMDDESIYNDDDPKMYDYIGKPVDENGFPPDLLPSYPPTLRAVNQISPAGSSASTVADTTRLPPVVHRPIHSPVHSPIYDHSIYRTLPSSRSHSPFATMSNGGGGHHHLPMRSAVRPGPGTYVTIPRRPGRASWSSEPPNMPEIGEPLYDNLGLRTTATGASALSLNKLGGGDTPLSPQMRPSHPLSPQPCDTIAEHHEPSPAMKPMMTQTLPRNLAAHRSALEGRGSWARSSDQDSRRDSTASLIPSSVGDPNVVGLKSPKIPPRPPPKPKKRVIDAVLNSPITVTTNGGPLFEDEGEDGTEV